MTSPWPLRASPRAKVPVTPVWPPMNATKSVPSARWTVGSQWLSVSVSASVGL